SSGDLAHDAWGAGQVDPVIADDGVARPRSMCLLGFAGIGGKLDAQQWKEPNLPIMMEHCTGTAPIVSDPLTWTEICARYPDEWVALVELDWVNENDLDFRSARVAVHV